MIRNTCNKFPKGILYCEVTETKEFMQQLAVSMKMKISPSNIIDLILGYFSTTHTLYYFLLHEPEKAFNRIMNTLQNAGEKFRSTHGKTPILFIDGADLLAKHDKNLFIHMLAQVKISANNIF